MSAKRERRKRLDARSRHIFPAPCARLRGARFSLGCELSAGIFPAHPHDSARRHDILFHLKNLCRQPDAFLAVARSISGVDYRTRRAQLFYDGLFESRQRYSLGTDAGHTRKRAAVAHQRADGCRRQLRVGLRAGDIQFISLSLLRLALLRRALSGKLSARARLPSADHARARLHRHPLGELCDGLQARRSVRYPARHRLRAFLRRLLSDTASRLRLPRRLTRSAANLRA